MTPRTQTELCTGGIAPGNPTGYLGVAAGVGHRPTTERERDLESWDENMYVGRPRKGSAFPILGATYRLTVGVLWRQQNQTLPALRDLFRRLVRSGWTLSALSWEQDMLSRSAGRVTAGLSASPYSDRESLTNGTRATLRIWKLRWCRYAIFLSRMRTPGPESPVDLLDTL